MFEKLWDGSPAAGNFLLRFGCGDTPRGGSSGDTTLSGVSNGMYSQSAPEEPGKALKESIYSDNEAVRSRG